MFSRRISVGVLAGIVGMAMLIATSGPSAAFTLPRLRLKSRLWGRSSNKLVGPVGPLARLAPVAPLGLGLASARL
jgi:hypothetical protein